MIEAPVSHCGDHALCVVFCLVAPTALKRSHKQSLSLVAEHVVPEGMTCLD